MPLWKIVMIALVFFGAAGLWSAFIAPVENRFWAETRTELLYYLPTGFDWTNMEYMKTFSKPILISVLFSLYHFWLPFNNVFRVLVFTPVFYIVYRKKNIYIGIWFHCICNLFSVVSYVLEIF